MVSIIDIARLAGTSKSTVSRVLTGSARVAPELRDRILTIIDSLGFVPNRAARSMAQQRTFTIGIVIPEAFNMFQRQLFAHIEHHLEHLGYRTDFFFEAWGATGEPSFLPRLKAERLDGVICIHEVTHPAFYRYLQGRRLPTVLCTFRLPDVGLASVSVDDVRGAALAARHLVALGHQRAALLGGPGFGFDRLRHQGFEEALASQGVTLDAADVVRMKSYSMEAGRLGMEALLNSGRDHSAVFAVTDELAIGAVRCAFEHGLRVPADVSIIGFDDIDVVTFLGPALSTVSQSIGELGLRTTSVLQDLLESKEPQEREVTIAPELVVRESTGPVGRRPNDPSTGGHV